MIFHCIEPITTRNSQVFAQNITKKCCSICLSIFLIYIVFLSMHVSILSIPNSCVDSMVHIKKEQTKHSVLYMQNDYGIHYCTFMLHACRLWEIYWDSYNWASIRIPSHLLVLHHGSIANPSEQKWLLDTLGHPTPSPRAGRKGPLGRRREEAQRDQEIMLSTLFSWPLIQQDLRCHHVICCPASAESTTEAQNKYHCWLSLCNLLTERNMLLSAPASCFV